MAFGKKRKIKTGWNVVPKPSKAEEAIRDFLGASTWEIARREWNIKDLYKREFGPMGTTTALHPEESARAEEGAEIFWDFLLEAGVPLESILTNLPVGVWASDIGEIMLGISVYGDDEPILIQENWIPTAANRYTHWRDPSLVVIDGDTVPEEVLEELLGNEHGVLLETPPGRQLPLGKLLEQKGSGAFFLASREDDSNTWFPYSTVGPMFPVDLPDASFLAGRF